MPEDNTWILTKKIDYIKSYIVSLLEIEHDPLSQFTAEDIDGI